MTKTGKDPAMRRIPVLLALILTLVLAVPAVAGGPTQLITASPTTDGEEIHRSGVQVAITSADRIDAENIAQAVPEGCTGCEGVAAAFQAVIVTGSPSQVTPTNIAAAVNTDCTSCNAYAYAYQYVVSADRGTRLSKRARGEIKRIRRQVEDVVEDDLTNAELDARLSALAARFKGVIVEDLERADADPRGGKAHRDSDAGEDEPGDGD